MATKSKVAFEFNANTSQAEAAVSSFKKQLKEATADLIAINEKFGATSTEAIKAAQRVAGLKDAIGDAKDLAAAFNPDAKFKALSQALSTATGGFAALQGAQALFGSQSEDLEKTLVKVQGALALSQGLEQLGGLADAFSNLKAVAVNAFNSIKTAIGSTGIGLLVIALGAIYAYWDDIKEAVSGVNAEQQKQNDLLKESVKKEEEKLNFIERNEQTLRLQGKSEKEILQLKVAAVKGEIEKQKQLIISNKLINDQRVAAAKQNYEILKGFLDFISIPQRKIYEIFSTTINKIISIANMLPGVDIKFKVNGQLAEEAPDWLAKKVFNVDEIKKQGDASNKEAQQQLETLTNKQSGYVLAIQKIEEENAAKKVASNAEKNNKVKEDDKKSDDNSLKDAVDRANQRSAILQQIMLDGIKDDFTKKQNELAIQQQAEDDRLTEAYNKGLLSLDEYNAAKKQANERHEKEQTELVKQNTEAKIKLAKAEKEARIETALAIADTLGNLSKLVGEQTAVGKSLAIAQTIISTIAGAQRAFESAQSLPPGIGQIVGSINAGIAIATGVANVKKILAVKVPGPGGGGGGGTPNIGGIQSAQAPRITPQAQITRLDQAQVNQIGNAAARAYVVESDISNGQERINRLNRAARIN